MSDIDVGRGSQPADDDGKMTVAAPDFDPAVHLVEQGAESAAMSMLERLYVVRTFLYHANLALETLPRLPVEIEDAYIGGMHMVLFALYNEPMRQYILAERDAKDDDDDSGKLDVGVEEFNRHKERFEALIEGRMHPDEIDLVNAVDFGVGEIP